MTLALTSVTSSGIVLTADSRQTYRNNAGMTRIGTDNATKLFELNRNTGAVISGRAFFQDKVNNFKDTGWFINEFKNSVLKDQQWSVKQIAEELNKYLTTEFLLPEETRIKDLLAAQVQLEGGTDFQSSRSGFTIDYSYKDQAGADAKKQWFIESISFTVAGYDTDGVGNAYLTTVPDGPWFDRSTVAGGVLWLGQTDVVLRITKGFSWELSELDFVRVAKANGVQVDQELNKLEYIINWGILPLQDAIDLCILLTRTTESIQRFSDGTVMHPGGITGVGGHINVASITPGRGFEWINKRDLVVSDR